MNKNILFSAAALVAIALAIFLMTRNPAKAPVQTANIEENGHTSISGSGEYILNAEGSFIAAQGRKPLIAGYADEATVSFKEGNVMLADGKISGSFTIDMASIAVKSTGKNSGETMLENHLKSDDFFNVEKYPESAFEIKTAEKFNGGDLYTVTGDLTVKGITKSITFPAVIYMKDKQLKAEGSIQLDRTKWDIRYGSGKFFENLGDKVIGDIFTLEFKITADPKK